MVSTESVSNKEVVMHIVGRIGIMGLGLALAGYYLSGVPVFAAELPQRPSAVDGSKIMITSPKDGDKVSDSFALKYELTKGSQVTHVHVYVDDEYQKGFSGALKGLSKGTHQITVKAATKDHDLAPAMHTITVEVQ
jgi:Big-like domain-containing protein